MSTDYNDWKEKQKCFKGIQNYHKECKSMTNGLPRNLKVTVNCSKFDKKKTYKAAIKLHHKKIRLKKKTKKKTIAKIQCSNWKKWKWVQNMPREIQNVNKVPSEKAKIPKKYKTTI